MNSTLLFSTIDVTRQLFYRTPLSFAFVNLKPIVPGHVLVASIRPVQRFQDLSFNEVSSLMYTVQTVGKVIERVYKADGLSIVCQDGKAAGQTVHHVHFHILPRKIQGDAFARNDDVYQAIENAEAQLPADSRETSRLSKALPVDADENRKPRSLEEMDREALWLSQFFEGDPSNGNPEKQLS